MMITLSTLEELTFLGVLLSLIGLILFAFKVLIEVQHLRDSKTICSHEMIFSDDYQSYLDTSLAAGANPPPVTGTYS